MSIRLPKPVAEYFAAERAGDAEALARCFAGDGVVHDEGGTFTGAHLQTRRRRGRNGKDRLAGDSLMPAVAPVDESLQANHCAGT